MNRLSHSSLSKWQTCPKAYEYRYVKRLYPKFGRGALLFGTALDEAIKTLLLEKNLQASIVKFNELWDYQSVNNIRINLSTSLDVVYAATDFDADLLTDQDWEQIAPNAQNAQLLHHTALKLKEEKGMRGLSLEHKLALNKASWLSLRQKGRIMIEGFNTHILPNITEVLGTQVEINLVNEDGDEIVGFADFVVKWKNEEVPIIFDLKTSSRNYEKDSVLTSQQLTIYTFALSEQFQTRRAGFIVLNKHIKKNKTKVCATCGYNGSGTNFKTCNNTINGKRCGCEWKETTSPDVFYQVIIDEIPEKLEDLVLENFMNISKSVNNNIFIRNLQSCKSPWECDYRRLCHYDNEDDLVYVPKEEEKDASKTT